MEDWLRWLGSELLPVILRDGDRGRLGRGSPHENHRVRGRYGSGDDMLTGDRDDDADRCCLSTRPIEAEPADELGELRRPAHQRLGRRGGLLHHGGVLTVGEPARRRPRAPTQGGLSSA